jgi:hypothetical protein
VIVMLLLQGPAMMPSQNNMSVYTVTLPNTDCLYHDTSRPPFFFFKIKVPLPRSAGETAVSANVHLRQALSFPKTIKAHGSGAEGDPIENMIGNIT